MVEVHDFSYGLLTPGLAYAMSSLGAFLGLRCTTRVRASTGRARAGWHLLAALSIGMSGIWAMHFIAMLGFTIPGQTIHYDVPVTVFSATVAVAVVSVGLLAAGFGGGRRWPLLAGGFVVGCGVAAMHYIGMAAMRMPDVVHYDVLLVAASVVIAIVAGTAALWSALRLGGLWSTLAAALIMGAAVSGMHYTGMAAMRVSPGGHGPRMLEGATAGGFLLPLVAALSILTFAVTTIIMLSPSEREIREEAELMRRLGSIRWLPAGLPGRGAGISCFHWRPKTT